MSQIKKQEIQKQLIKQGIDPQQVEDLHLKLKMGEISHDSFIIAEKDLKVPADTDFDFHEKIKQAELKKIGEQAIANDELLVFWLNGGAATRYFDESKINDQEKELYKKELKKITPEIKKLPKGVTPVLADMTYLELKIKNLLQISADLNLKKHPQVLLMNSFLTDKPTKKHLQNLFKKYPELIPERFHYIVQRPKVPRFKKVANLAETDLFIDQKGHLSFSPAGHGDFLYLTQEYLAEEKIQNAKYLFFNNIDNFGSYIDPVILGFHIQSQKGRTVEVSPKNPGDKGGAPCFVGNNMIIIEDMKFPKNFDQDQLKYFNTNNFWFTIKDLIKYEEELPLIIAEKTIAQGEVIQLEHFACDVNVPSAYLVVPRDLRF